MVNPDLMQWLTKNDNRHYISCTVLLVGAKKMLHEYGECAPSNLVDLFPKCIEHCEVGVDTIHANPSRFKLYWIEGPGWRDYWEARLAMVQLKDIGGVCVLHDWT
jgi:hypothetical protein